MSRQSNYQAAGGRSFSHQLQQHRTSTPSRILDELLALGPQVAPANVTVLDYRNSKWRQEGALDESFSRQFAQALGESLAAGSSRESPASSGASNSTLTPAATSGGEQGAFSFDPFQPTSVAPALNGVKILDIRRTKTDRRRAASPAGRAEELALDQLQRLRTSRGNTQASSGQHRSNQPQQRQQSGETLSSYESDYDLLVYLGETETEDIVETERSLDYQDQTWRQSICGGASLAPTIDESLSELLSTGHVGSSQLLVGPSVTPSRLNPPADTFDSSRAPTSTLNSLYRAERPATLASNDNQSSNWSSTLPHPSQQQQSPRRNAQNGNLSSTLNVHPSSRAQPASLALSEQVPYSQGSSNSLQEQLDAATSSKLGLGNKFVSFFNRKQPQRQQTIETTEPIEQTSRAADEQQWASLSNLPTSQPPRQFASNLSARHKQELMAPSRRYQHVGNQLAENTDDAAELDRLLAEMSQSLDLDSLSRFDPHKGRPPLAQREQSRPRKTLPGPTQPPRTTAISRPSQVSTTRLRGPPPEQSPYANLPANSLLDEYDGASKMLEQMISEQLDESSRSARSTTLSSEALPNPNKSQANQPKSVSRKFSSSSAATTEASVISNPLVKRTEISDGSERYENPSAHQPAPNERVIRVERERDANHIATRHPLKSASSLEVPDKKSPEYVANAPNSQLVSHQKAQVRPAQANKLDRRETMVKAELQSPRHGGAARSTSSSSSASSASSRPPKPPAPDYHEEAPTSLESHVIQVEAARLSSSLSSGSDDETNIPKKPQHKQMVKQMKRRTLSGMRSVRDKFNDLTSARRDSTKLTKEDQRQQSFQLAGHGEDIQGPKPPKRSSSIGSNKSATQSTGQNARVSDAEQLEARLKSPEPMEASPRQSRGRERRREVRREADPTANKRDINPKDAKSFGQQLRERLSRSKSRFRQLLSGPQLFRKRAQSTPDERRHLSAREISAPIPSGADLALYQPGDIARNTPTHEQRASPISSPDRPVRRDRFDSSLERHLMASLDPKKAAQSDEAPNGTSVESAAVAQTRKSSSSSTSDLSGLDTTGRKQVSRFELPPMARSARAARRRRQLKCTDKEEVDIADARKGPTRRPTSLISLKRLSGSFSRAQPKERNAGGEIEDLDSMKVNPQLSSSSQNLAGGSSKSSKRRAKRRNKSNLSERRASPDSSTKEQLAPKRATTDDYFGPVAPLKATDSPEPAKPPASVHLRIEMGPRVRPASALQGDGRASLSSRDRSKPTSDKVAHRSHSLRSIGKKGPTEGQEDELKQEMGATGRAAASLNQKSVSFHNLAVTAAGQRRQLCPASPNSFRPTSVTPVEPIDSKMSIKEAPTNVSSASCLLMPVQPTQTPSTETSTAHEPEALKAPEVRSCSKSPIRERGAALLGDIRTKYNELFRPNSNRKAGPTSARSISPPARPPRRRKRGPQSVEASRRARSLAAGELPRDQNEPRFIEVDPSSPPTSLLLNDSRPETPSADSKATKQPAGKRLVELASHLKSSAADFFSSGKSSSVHEAARPSTQTPSPNMAARQRPFLRSIDEPVLQDDLCHWRPIIESSRKISSAAGANQNSRLLTRSGSKDATAKSDSPVGLKSRPSVDSDSSWESSESSHKEERTSDQAEIVRTDLASPDESSRQPASSAQQVASTSGTERETAPARPPGTVTGSPPPDDELRASARHGSISHANSGQQLAEAVRAELNEAPPAPASARLGGHSAVGGARKTFPTGERADHAKTKSIEKCGLESDICGNLIGDRNNNTQQHRQTPAEHPDERGADAASERLAAPRGKIVAHGGLKSAGSRPIGETKAPLEEEQEANLKSDASQQASRLQQAVARFEPNGFKFNENLPSPSEFSQDQTNAMAIEGAARSTANQRQFDAADLQFIKATSHRRPQSQAVSRPGPSLKPQAQDENSQQNRLSIYENVSQHEQPPDSSQAIQTRHLMGSSLLSVASQCEQTHRHSDANPDDEWRVDPDERLVQKFAGLKSSGPQVDAAQTCARPESRGDEVSCAKRSASVSKKPERKLVSMTSIIHEPEDDLMNTSTTSTSVTRPTDDQQNSDQMKPQSREAITIDELDDLLDNGGGGNDAAAQDDDDDSFAVAAASRKLLINRFQRKLQPKGDVNKRTFVDQSHKRSASVKQQAAAYQQSSASLNQASLRPAPRQTGGSLVHRLAKNFDQTVDEQPAARGLIQISPSRRQPPLLVGASAASSSSKQAGSKVPLARSPARHPLKTLASLEQDEPKSDSTWYDAKSIELLDEAEVAELLREFDDESAHASVSNKSQATNEPYLSVGDQQAGELTLSHDDTGQRDNHAHQDDDDPTLNDDETLNEDDQTEPNADLLDQEEEESVYASLATSSQQAAHKGKDQISPTNLASPAATSSSATPLVGRSPAAAGARDVLRAPKQLNGGSRVDALEASARQNDTKIEGQSCQHKDFLSPALRDIDSNRLIDKEAHQQQQKQEHPRQASMVKNHLNLPPPPLASHFESSQRFAKGDTIETVVSQSSNSVETNSPATHKTSPTTPTPTQTRNTQTDREQIDKTQVKLTSSMFSPSLSSSDSLNNDDLMALEALNSKSLVQAAKRCSRLYEELEKLILARASAVERRPTSEESDCKSETPLDTTLTARDQEPHDYDLDEPERRDSATSGQQQALSQVRLADLRPDDLSSDVGEYEVQYEEGEGDELVATDTASDQSSSRADDQCSISSSSLHSESLPEILQRQNLQKLYNIVNEICSSEEKFLATLRLLNVDFRWHIHNCLHLSQAQNGNPNSKQQALQQAPFDVVGTLLKHLPQLQALNENLLAELERARDQWPKTQKISHVLIKIGPFLKHYSGYARDFKLVQAQFEENLRKSAHFSEVITGFERTNQDKCQKLSVQHHFLHPIQRISQYRLLLQQYLRHLKPDDADYEDTVRALEVVSRVVEHADHSLSEGANFSKLLALQSKNYGKQLDIVRPGRLLVKEGELLKVSRKQIQSRWLVLLNDSLLYFKKIQSSDILYLKYELPLDDCQVSVAEEEASERRGQPSRVASQSTDREFDIRTTVRSMTLVAKNAQERNAWLAALRATIGEHVAKQRSFQQASGDSPQRTSPGGSLPDLIGRKAPIWTPDSRVATCQLCTSNFSALFRRHHCRACGRVVCSACSGNRAPLIYLKCRAARVCDQCFDQLRDNMHLYYRFSAQIDEREMRRIDEHFKTLLKSQFVKHVIGWSKSNKAHKPANQQK